MHFPDFGNLVPIPMANPAAVRAIGWLSATHVHATGMTPPAFAGKLREICAHWSKGLEALGWPAAAGSHTCEFCGSFRTSGNVGVPWNDVLFVSPEMVAHYVETHSYLPPAEFIEAVLASPVPGTVEYAEAVQKFASPAHDG